MARMLYQFNEYGCGVFAVMNALRHQFELYPLRYMYSQIEEELDTDKEYGTQEGPMIKKLRKDFYVSIKRSFDKAKLDEWLRRGDEYQAIILYSWTDDELELHYCNVTDKYDGLYYGANFYTGFLGFRHWVHESWVNKWFDTPHTSVIYLRKRD